VDVYINERNIFSTNHSPHIKSPRTPNKHTHTHTHTHTHLSQTSSPSSLDTYTPLPCLALSCPAPALALTPTLQNHTTSHHTKCTPFPLSLVTPKTLQPLISFRTRPHTGAPSAPTRSVSAQFSRFFYAVFTPATRCKLHLTQIVKAPKIRLSSVQTFVVSTTREFADHGYAAAFAP
jgi:hypothetical protein